jgi:hypothetical protein
MRCSKLRELYLRNRDGLLNEAEKMKLEEHMDVCPTCASYAREVDRCLDLLNNMPEMSPSENFEWNLKRAILHEKTRLVRQRLGVSFGDWQWGVRFVSSAAAVALVVIAGAWFISERAGRTTIQGVPMTSRNSSSSSVRLSPRDYGIINFTSSGYQTGRRSANHNLVDYSSSVQPAYSTGPGFAEGVQATPFASSSREDSLMKENEFLWKRVESLEKEIMVLQRFITRERARR